VNNEFEKKIVKELDYLNVLSQQCPGRSEENKENHQ
jgi:hypothetical protein